MPQVQSFDDIDILYKINEDGSVSHTDALGEIAFNKAIADGWTPIHKLPHLDFPTVLYRPSGATKIVKNIVEKERAMAGCVDGCASICPNHNWVTKAYAAPVEREFYGPLPPAEPGSRAAQQRDAELELANLKIQNQESAISELQSQLAEVLALLKPKGKKNADSPANSL